MPKDELKFPNAYIPEDLDDYRLFVNFLSRVCFEKLNVKNLHIDFENKNGGLDTLDYRKNNFNNE